MIPVIKRLHDEVIKKYFDQFKKNNITVETYNTGFTIKKKGDQEKQWIMIDKKSWSVVINYPVRTDISLGGIVDDNGKIDEKVFNNALNAIYRFIELKLHPE